MARKKIFGIAERDWPDVRKLIDEFRKVGRTLRKPDKGGEAKLGRGGAKSYIGKLSADVAAGVTIASGVTFNVRRGPAHPDDATDGTLRTIDLEGGYPWDAITTSDWARAYKENGYWYVQKYCST